MISIKKFKGAYYWQIAFDEFVVLESENLYLDADSAEVGARDHLRNLASAMPYMTQYDE